MQNKIIKFKSRDRSERVSADLIQTLEELATHITNDDVEDIVIVWRTKESDERVEYFLTNYAWWSRVDRHAALGLLDYIKDKILSFLRKSDG
jgi:hypothetical protein